MLSTSIANYRIDCPMRAFIMTAAFAVPHCLVKPPKKGCGARPRNSQLRSAYKPPGTFSPVNSPVEASSTNARFDFLDFRFGFFFQAYQRIPGSPVDPDQLVELELEGLRVAILGALDDEDHQKRHDCGARIDDELPGIGPAKETGRSPPTERRRRSPAQRQSSCRAAAQSSARSWRRSSALAGPLPF